MYKCLANPNSTASAKITNTMLTSVSSDAASFTVSSVSSSHESMETSATLIYPQAMNTAAYILNQLNPEEEQNLFYIIDSIPDSERNSALQQLAFAEQLTFAPQPTPDTSIESPTLLASEQPQKEEATTSSAALKRTRKNKSTSFTKKMGLIDNIPEIDQQKRDEYLKELTTALEATGLEVKDAIKITIVKSLLEGKSEKQIIKECRITTKQHKRPVLFMNKFIILSMFEYYKLGGLTLLRGYPYASRDPLPAKLMHQALTMYQEKKSPYTEILHVLESEIEHNPEYLKIKMPQINYKKVITFLERCGVIVAKSR